MEKVHQAVITDTLHGFSLQPRPKQGEVQAMLPALKPTLLSKKKLKPFAHMSLSQSRLRKPLRPE